MKKLSEYGTVLLNQLEKDRLNFRAEKIGLLDAKVMVQQANASANVLRVNLAIRKWESMTAETI